MEIIIRPDAESAAKLVAAIVAKTVRENPQAVLGLATGQTMIPVYADLAARHAAEGLSFAEVTTFNLDEFVGCNRGTAYSFAHFMEEHLIRHIDADPERCFIPDGCAEDLRAECEAYEEAIRDSGGIDLQLLGLGLEGHIGFNEPLSAFGSRTRVKSLFPKTSEASRGFFPAGMAVPGRGITVGIETIMEARRIVMLVTGARKAEMLARAVEGPLAAIVPASALQLHPSCQIVADEAAARELKHTEYYRHVFETEPEWEEFR